MKASVVDLRYKMKDVLAALERREEIKILYHGRVKGTIVPAAGSRKIKMADHPFFGMNQKDVEGIPEIMSALRKGRVDAL